jgi:hypothetical protein
MPGYVSARPRAQLIDVLLAAQIALYALRVLGALYFGVAPEGGLSDMLRRGAQISAPFLVVLFIATAISMLLWLDRAARNLPALGARNPIAPEHVVGVFFAPVMNLVAIPHVVYHVWATSDPTPPRRGWLIIGWWPTLLVGAMAHERPLVSAALLLGSALSLLAIVRDAQRRQDEQFRDEELRRAVPQPTADALR